MCDQGPWQPIEPKAKNSLKFCGAEAGGRSHNYNLRAEFEW